MTNVLILSERSVKSAPRILREISALEKNFNLILCATETSSESFKSFINIYSLRSLRDKLLSRFDGLFSKIKLRYSKIDELIQQKNIQVLIIHDPLFIEEAVRLKQKFGLKIVFNAHEYHPLEFENDKKWLKTEGKLYDYLYRNKLQKFDLIINVCDTIKQKCFDEYQLQSIVIPNAAVYRELTPIFNETPIRIRLIHHGALLPGRKMEKMIEVVSTLSATHTLDIIGVYHPETASYYQYIQSLCEHHDNIQLIEPVSFDEIVPFINKYDMGLYLLEPSNFNNFNALPNKLFEFIQARLAVAVSPSPEMQRIVHRYKNGIVAEDFTIESMRNALLSIDREQIDLFKQNSHAAASVENAEKYYQLYLDSLLSLLKN